MDLDALDAQIAETSRKLESAMRRVEGLQADLDALRRTRDIFSGAGAGNGSARDSKVNATELTRRAIAEFGADSFGSEDIERWVQHAAGETEVTKNAIQTALSRMLKRGDILQVEPKRGTKPATYRAKHAAWKRLDPDDDTDTEGPVRVETRTHAFQ